MKTKNTPELEDIKLPKNNLKDRLKNILILALLLSVALTYFIMESRLRRATQAHEAAITTLTEQNSQAMAELRIQAETFIEFSNRTYVHMLMKPLAWAVRAEMIRDNREQIDTYLAQFVKEKYVASVMVVDPEGNIIMASNKKMVGQAFASAYPPALLSNSATMVESAAGGEYFASTPLMGYDVRMGSLVANFQPEVFQPFLLSQ
ncbi:putative membrane protein affecting hemolysin expression [Catalinimonas alkaloidigena]|uniref:hypothetical protein n=1 Tax=Catalinimonas alkaloidigena TaxID=1075417 RepID=UPI0024070099|nr:hypothetical protein [Catalinimonas alkaloidigena]MDF9798956.1 putative membrane protein affecting hemolysin expression [Catalinimonas alkaloidigena]